MALTRDDDIDDLAPFRTRFAVQNRHCALRVSSHETFGGFSHPQVFREERAERIANIKRFDIDAVVSDPMPFAQLPGLLVTPNDTVLDLLWRSPAQHRSVGSELGIREESFPHTVDAVK
jgi:hypothetical protein